jgi:hypothetical protein
MELRRTDGEPQPRTCGIGDFVHGLVTPWVGKTNSIGTSKRQGGTVMKARRLGITATVLGIGKDANGRFIKGDLVGYAVMEKRTGWGVEYPEEKRNGEWEYQVFMPDRKINEKANLNSCFECHKPHASTDYLFTADKIKAASK